MERGILVSQDIQELIETGVIISDDPIHFSQIQPSSLDLSLGHRAYKVMASTLPKPHEGKQDFLDRVSQKGFDLDDELYMEKDSKYLVELAESVKLPVDTLAVLNNKSSSGRINIRTKLVSSCGYDILHKGFESFCFLEVTPRSFPIIVRSREVLSQMRFFQKKLELADNEVNHHPFVFNKDGSQAIPSLREGILLTLDLESDIIGYKARKNTPAIDLARRDHIVDDFFETLLRKNIRRMILNKDEFYILATKEHFSVPWNFIAEMQPYDLASGEFRSHYAGFIDPGFGYGEAGEVKGRQLTLEVNPHDDIELHDGQVICKVKMEHTTQKPSKIYGVNVDSHYHQQSGPRLSKYFSNS